MVYFIRNSNYYIILLLQIKSKIRIKHHIKIESQNFILWANTYPWPWVNSILCPRHNSYSMRWVHRERRIIIYPLYTSRLMFYLSIRWPICHSSSMMTFKGLSTLEAFLSHKHYICNILLRENSKRFLIVGCIDG